MDAAHYLRIFQFFISHNVPAVYDVFAVAIKERVRSSNRKNVAEFWRGNGAQRNDLAKT
jgi:hypothetical protein